MSRRASADVPSPNLGDRPLSIRPRPVHPRQLNRDDLTDLLSQLHVIDLILYTVSSGPTAINTAGDFFAGLAQISENVAKDIQHLIDEDAEFDRMQGGAR